MQCDRRWEGSAFCIIKDVHGNSAAQSSAMSLAINVVAVLLAGFAAASAGFVPFPHGKTLVYKYYGDVKAGIIEPAAYASQFALEGTFYVKHDTSDPALKNAYYVALSNVKTGMHNGMAAHYQRTNTLKPIEGFATKIQEPFLIIFDDNGRFEGVKFPANEMAWSKNMKMAIASMLQLDLPNIRLDTPMKPHSFISKESTIHGPCWITYDVQAKDYTQRSAENGFVVTKFSSPKNCSGFAVHSFNHVENIGCQAKSEEPVNVASRRVFEVEKQGKDIIIKKLVAHGGSNYFPHNARSEAHYILTNTTFALDRVAPVSEISLPPVDFKSQPITHDITYLKPQGNYAPNAAVDVTQGRRVVRLDVVVSKVKKMLGEAADYIEENHLEAKEPDWKHGQTMNRLLQAMGYMDVASLRSVFNVYKNAKTPRDVTMKNTFLGMVPHVGTSATALFTLDVIRKKQVSVIEAIGLLSKLPMNVKTPSEALLSQMEELAKFGDSIPAPVRKASILCFSSLIYQTFKNVPHTEQQTRPQKYLEHFFNLLQNDKDYAMKVTYLMAIKNIRFGNIHTLLAPIIRGDLVISENPVHIRLLAIWAIDKAIKDDYHYAHDLLWPVMADKSLPVKLRIAAYEILMHQAPSMTDVLHIYWFMVYERNEHLYNYHHTTIKGIANSVDPCSLNLRELVRKIMRFTRVHETIHYTLSSAFTVDYKDELYNHAEKLQTGMIVNELTGVPEVLHFDHVITDGRRPYSNIEVRLHVQGFDEILTLLKHGQFSVPGGLSNAFVLGVLKKAAEKLPPSRKIHIDIVLSHKGHVFSANHYNENTLMQLYDAANLYIKNHSDGLKINSQHVAYDHLYEKQVTSDMGLPVVFESRIPSVMSLKLNYNRDSSSNAKTINLDIDGKIWRHGDYSISVYNTMSDTWHAIRRSTATDINLPLRTSITYDSEKQNLKLNFPMLPATRHSEAGVVTHAKDCVTVNEDDAEILKKSCPTCRLMEDVTTGIQQKKEYKSHFDSKDTGLKYSMSLFDCESGVTPVMLSSEWYRAFKSERKNDWNHWPIRGIMAVRQQLKNMLISPRMGSCGGLLKIEPSIVHATSRIDLSLRTDFEDVDHTNPTFHLFSNEKHNIHATVNVIAAATNTSARSWDLNVNVQANQGHMMNVAKVHLTRKTPGETNLKICVDAQKSYAAVPKDPLKLGITKEETNSKLTIAVERTNADECTRNDIMVKLVMKGQMSDEQKKAFTKEMENGACTNDINNPVYANPKNIVPKTLNCINEAIRSTSLRKYNIIVTQKKVPKEIVSKVHHFEDIIRSTLLPNLKYKVTDMQPENIKIDVEFPVQKDVLELSVATPDVSYDLIDASFDKPRFNGFGPVIKPVWKLPLDNTRFTIPSLIKYTHDQLKVCSIYPQVVLTGDGKSVPFTITDQWTLISGDHFDQRFAVFAKTAGSNLATRVYIKNHQLDIVPNNDNSFQVTVDGGAVKTVKDGFIVPNDNKKWILKVTTYNDQIIVQMKNVPLTFIHGINHVALAVETELQGKVSGLCGRLDGTYLRGIPETYTMPNN